MDGNDQSQWSNLVVEQGATPLALDDAVFRQWMTGRRIFVSSPMDAEMEPDRDALRRCISGWGAVPVMWEAITPRDQRAEGAYLEGVNTSALFVLVLGSRYGIADASGYSPTHKEAIRARERQLPRLLFVRVGINDADRDGKLNDWLRGLYTELSGARYQTSADLCMQLEQRLRETAAQQESLWLKLGPLVFPGRVAQRRSAQGAIYTVSARVRDASVRRALSSLVGPYGGSRADRLTWTTETHQITVQDVVTDTSRTSESDVTVTCAQSNEQRGGHAPLGGMTYMGRDGRSFGPADQAELWAQSAIFGVAAETARGQFDTRAMLPAHEGPTLPQVLQSYSGSGWLAEGLTRLFLVEQLTARFGGHLNRLEVGPATATGVRIQAEFVPEGAQNPALIEGVVPLT